MFSPWERANPARSHGFSPLEKFFCFLKTFFQKPIDKSEKMR